MFTVKAKLLLLLIFTSAVRINLLYWVFVWRVQRLSLSCWGYSSVGGQTQQGTWMVHLKCDLRFSEACPCAEGCAELWPGQGCWWWWFQWEVCVLQAGSMRMLCCLVRGWEGSSMGHQIPSVSSSWWVIHECALLLPGWQALLHRGQDRSWWVRITAGKKKSCSLPVDGFW